jgi:hypothetical protein
MKKNEKKKEILKQTARKEALKNMPVYIFIFVNIKNIFKYFSEVAGNVKYLRDIVVPGSKMHLLVSLPCIKSQFYFASLHSAQVSLITCLVLTVENNFCRGLCFV